MVLPHQQHQRTDAREISNGMLTVSWGATSSENIELSLRKLLPWRKGPFLLNDLVLQSEWLGDLKWERINKKIRPLKNKRVLDIGAGNGYFSIRMALEGANKVLGIEPFMLFNYQFSAIETLSKNSLVRSLYEGALPSFTLTILDISLTLSLAGPNFLTSI